MNCTRWQLQWRSRLICVPAALLLFVFSAQAQTDTMLPPTGGDGGVQFVARCPQRQHLTGFDLRVGDDVDAIRPLCVTAYGPADVGPIEPHPSKFGGTGGSADRQLLCPRDFPIVTGMYVRATGGEAGVYVKAFEGTVVVHEIWLICVTAAAYPERKHSPFPSPKFSGPGAYGISIEGRFVPTGVDDVQTCGLDRLAVGISGRSGKWLDAVGLICGEPKLTPPVKAQGRVRLPLIVSNDFNNDGRGDILWHNASTGESQVWLLSGSSRIGRATILDGARPALIGPPWHIVGSRDFNGDGKADVLWHNGATGETQIWFMNGAELGGRATVLGENGSPALVGAPWSIVGTNDMNGDKQSDLIWHNGATGETQIWQMNGNRVSGRVTVLGENGAATLVGLPWRVVGSGDFGGDGKPDVLWHNGSTGETQVWHLNGYRLTGRATVLGENGNAAFVGLPWRIAGTNDFNQDGAADILWHNGSTGETQMWLMNGRSVVRRASLDADRDGGGPRVGLPWSVMPH